MKIIDLLNKIANGEIDYTRRFDAKVGMNYCNINSYFEVYPINENYLNAEIDLEILEEENKIPEKLHHCYTSTDNEDIKFLIKNINEFVDRYNELLDYLKSKGE